MIDQRTLPSRGSEDAAVFISYAAEDRAVSSKVVGALEANAIRCWVAPRDIPPGADYAEAIIAAIRRCRAMVLVFSWSASRSPHVRREVERAASADIPILPFFIEDVPLSGAMEYFLSSSQWLQAFSQPLEPHLEELIGTLQHLLSRPSPSASITSTHRSNVFGVDLERMRQHDDRERPRRHKVDREVIVGLRFADVSSEGFRDRVEVADELRQHLRDQAVKLVCIVGRSGMGKTALLSKICGEIEMGELRLSHGDSLPGADGMIYISSRGSDRPTLERIIRDIGRTLGSPHTEDLLDYWHDSTRSLEDKVRFLLSRLRHGQYLLLIDNLEEALSSDNTLLDPDLRAFIDLCLTTPHGLRVVATSRQRLAISGSGMRAVRIISLAAGLPEEEGVALLRDLDGSGDLGLRDAPGALLQEAVRRCYSVPRALEAVAGILASDQTLTLGRLLEKTDLFGEQVVENLVEAHYLRLTVEQRAVIQALSVYGKPVAAAALRYLLQPSAPTVEIESCLRVLVSNYLTVCYRAQDTYGLHPLDQQYVYAQLRNVDKHDYHRRAAEFYLSLCTGNEQDDVEMQLEAWEQYFAGEHYTEAEQVLTTVAFPLTETQKRRDLFVGMVDRLAAVSPSISPKFVAWKAKLLKWSGNVDAAVALGQALAASDDPFARAVAYEALAYFYADMGKLAEAEDLARQSVSLLRDHEDQEMYALALKTAGYVLYEMNRISEALEYHKECLAVRTKIAPHRAEAGIELAEIYEMLGDLEDAERFARLHCTIYQTEWSRYYAALGMRVLALVEYDRANYSSADEICSDAVQIVTKRAPYQSDLAKVEITAARIKRALGEHPQALALLADARRIYSEGGVPKMLALALYETALVHERLGEMGEACKLYREALALDSPATNYRCRIKLGLAAAVAGDEGEAQADLAVGTALCREILDKTPRHYDALYSLALAQCAAGETALAHDTYQRALAVCAGKGIVADAIHDLLVLGTVTTAAGKVDDLVNTLLATEAPDAHRSRGRAGHLA